MLLFHSVFIPFLFVFIEDNKDLSLHVEREIWSRILKKIFREF